jgi:hypothetical protein
MRSALLAAIALSASGCASVGPCGFADHELLGSWRHVSGPSFFEEIAFERDDTGQWFHSWLHERPEVLGTPWRVADCTLTVDAPGDTTPWTFTEVRQRGNTLLLRESAGSEPWIFERVPE